VYVTPGCFVHPKSRAFWLGGVSGDSWPAVRGPAGTGSVGDGVGEGAEKAAGNSWDRNTFLRTRWVASMLPAFVRQIWEHKRRRRKFFPPEED